MERDYYHSIDSLKFIAVACFMYFVFGMTDGVGNVVRNCLSFAVPLLFMTYGFLLLGNDEDQSGIIGRSIGRNCAVFGISIIVFALISFAYVRLTDTELVFSTNSIIDFLLYGKWQLPVGEYVWFTASLVLALVVFFIFSKTTLLRRGWFVVLLLVVTLGVNLVFGEFSGLFKWGYLPNGFFNSAIPFMLIGKIIKDRENQVFDLGPIVSAVVVVIGLLVTFGEMYMLNYFTRFNFTSNYIGSLICAIGFLMFAVQFPDFGEMSGFAYWGGGCATWMFLLANPVSMFINYVLPQNEQVIFIFKPFIIFLVSMFIALIITSIIHLTSPSPKTSEDGESEEEDDDLLTE